MKNRFHIFSPIFFINVPQFDSVFSKLRKAKTFKFSFPEKVHIPAAQNVQISRDVFVEHSSGAGCRCNCVAYDIC